MPCISLQQNSITGMLMIILHWADHLLVHRWRMLIIVRWHLLMPVDHNFVIVILLLFSKLIKMLIKLLIIEINLILLGTYSLKEVLRLIVNPYQIPTNLKLHPMHLGLHTERIPRMQQHNRPKLTPIILQKEPPLLIFTLAFNIFHHTVMPWYCRIRTQLYIRITLPPDNHPVTLLEWYEIVDLGFLVGWLIDRV